MSAERDDAFVAFVAARRRHLLRVATLLTGNSTDAEDLVQTALTKLYIAWSRVGHDRPEAYVRQVMVRTHIDDRRRAWRRRERTMGEVPERAERPVQLAEDGAAIRAALDRLTPRQRVTVVLRYWLDLSVEQTATAMGCSPGTVKSQSARAVVVLRAAIGSSFADGVEPPGGDPPPTYVGRAGAGRSATRQA